MPSLEIEEFARSLVEHVRDEAVRECDMLLQVGSHSPVAERWRKATQSGAAATARAVVPDCVDETIFQLLNAIDEGLLQIRYVSRTGKVVDLTSEGSGELAGWYMGSGGWRGIHSRERFVDDFADLDPDK